MRFGRYFANCIRRGRPSPTDKWHLDEVVITIRGLKHWLWRAIDGPGDTLDILVQTPRNAKAARRFFAKPTAQFGLPRVAMSREGNGQITQLYQANPSAMARLHRRNGGLIETSAAHCKLQSTTWQYH